MHAGIDLGGKMGRTTAICFLSEEKGNPRIEGLEAVPPGGDEHIIESIIKRKERIETVSIDSPFDFPVCVRCNLPRCPGVDACDVRVTRAIRGLGGNPYAQRLVEIVIKDYGIRPIQTSALGQIVSRAKFLRKRLESEGIDLSRILEVYPKGSLICLAKSRRFLGDLDFQRAIAEYKRKDEERARAASRTLVQRLGLFLDFAGLEDDCIAHHDLLDAVIASYTGWVFSKGLTMPIPDEIFQEDGWIYLPDFNRL